MWRPKVYSLQWFKPGLAFAGFLISASLAAQSIDVQYGVVTGVQKSKVSADSSGRRTGVKAGGLIGGLLGATSSGSSGKKRRRALLYGSAGAMVGGAAGSAAGSQETTIYQYSVKLLQSDTIVITTEQGRIDRGDCVSIEHGTTANIRRVAQVLCDVPQTEVVREHRAEAEECSAAKQELVAAQGDDAIDGAIRKVKILCDD